ncbi:MAG: hypothetical protein KGR46_12055 [Verrucomicrobia bacterium]|nr:hypothetical protein [Verrucomicrobiota bacterium]
MPAKTRQNSTDAEPGALHAIDPEKALRVRKRRRRSTDPAGEQPANPLPEPIADPRVPNQPIQVFFEDPSKRRRNILLVAGAVAAAFAAASWLVGGFFYESGLSEGMRRGLDASSIDSQSAAGENNDPVFSALLNIRPSKLDRPTTELLATLVLDKLRDTTKERLPGYLKPGHSTVEDFADAYVAMRLGDFGQAAAILRETEPKIPPDLFKYLMNEPAMREFAREPRVMGFY